MELGFETIGNATLICHDRGPLITTDPWIHGSAYFGSWITSHEIPAEQLAHVEACKYLWISHGHPDHLSPESLERLRDKEILLPDHHGGRIAKDLEQAGYRVRVLADGVWTPLSDRVRVLSIADFCQDAILLVDLDGRLIVNSNDASDNGAGPFVRETVRRSSTRAPVSARRIRGRVLQGQIAKDLVERQLENGERVEDGARGDGVGHQHAVAHHPCEGGEPHAVRGVKEEVVGQVDEPLIRRAVR